MATTITSGGGNTTVDFSYTTTTTKMINTINDAIRYEYGEEDPVVDLNGVAIQFSVMTNQQKADYLWYFIRNLILSRAKEYNISRDIKAAQAAAETENQTDYDLT